MKNKLNSKGFSLVELIIVMAIMAVLIGVLAPIYLQYVDRTKRTADCTSIGVVLDPCDVLAADPDVNWTSGKKIIIVIDTNKVGHETTYSGTGPVAELEELASSAKTSLTSTEWGPFTIEAIKDSNGQIIFDIQNNSQITELAAYSTVLSERLE